MANPEGQQQQPTRQLERSRLVVGVSGERPLDDAAADEALLQDTTSNVIDAAWSTRPMPPGQVRSAPFQMSTPNSGTSSTSAGSARSARSQPAKKLAAAISARVSCGRIG